MKTSLVLITLSLLVSLCELFAQSSKVPPPATPILRHMPAFASWTISYTYKTNDKASSPTLQLKQDLPQNLTITKTDKSYREVTVFASGKQSERWIYDGVVLQRAAGSSTIVPLSPPSELAPNPDYPDYTRDDFRDLQWLSMSYYAGVQTLNGKSVYSFEGRYEGRKVSALLSVPDQSPLTTTDDNISSAYTYNPPPTEALTLPPDFMHVLTLRRQALEALKYHPSPP